MTEETDPLNSPDKTDTIVTDLVEQTDSDKVTPQPETETMMPHRAPTEETDGNNNRDNQNEQDLLQELHNSLESAAPPHAVPPFTPTRDISWADAICQNNSPHHSPNTERTLSSAKAIS
eukprot:8098977-Ditylum_brightwellii.AAC.1